MSVFAFEATVWVHSSALRRELKTAADVENEAKRIKEAIIAIYPDALTDDSVEVEIGTIAGNEE